MICHLGTSGWSYSYWKGRFYPEEVSQKKWLPFYARHFNTVEINMTFYRFPKAETLKGWLDKVPDTMVETAETSYFRFHGLTGGYRYSYPDEELKEWAKAIKKTKARECYIYFNNDYHAHAVANCKTLGKLLQKSL